MIEKIAVIGLGYVGLPLAMRLSDSFTTIGFDTNQKRIQQLSKGIDQNSEHSSHELGGSEIKFTNDHEDLSNCTAYIVTVPTPVDDNKNPDLEPLSRACKLVGKFISEGDVIIFESTVYPGCIEGFCGPILEETSNLVQGVQFHLGYSPERISPGDKKNRIETITKIVSGDSKKSLNRVTAIYENIIMAGIYQAKSIRVAEAAKLTENIQRDVNIALMNELSAVFLKMNINTRDVLNAASTKWNFIPFQPGLVGGHCIGVDPYYLIHAAERHGISTPLLSAARNVNEGTVLRVRGYIQNLDSKIYKKILILGMSFKENCNDTRNSKALELAEFLSHRQSVHIFDPGLNPSNHTDLDFVTSFEFSPYDVIIFAVNHRQFSEINYEKLKDYLTDSGKIVDLTCTLSIPDGEGFTL